MSRSSARVATNEFAGGGRIMRFGRSKWILNVGMIGLLVAGGCSDDDPLAVIEAADTSNTQKASSKLQCAADNAGLTLPSGFCAIIVADLTMDGAPAAARHMAITPSGNLFVAINSPRNANP